MTRKSAERSSKYILSHVAQVSKHGQIACGDFCLCRREGGNTFFVLCDGIGSGTRAHLSAVMCANRLMELITSGTAVREAAMRVAAFMGKARTEPDFPFAAFSVVKIMSDGRFTVACYESPQPLIAEHSSVMKPNMRYDTTLQEVVGFCMGKLSEGDSLILMSDGITQAGLGEKGSQGLGTEGFIKNANHHLQRGGSMEKLCDDSLLLTARISGGVHHDDTTIAALKCRKANVLNVMTGPASSIKRDEGFVNDFMLSYGSKAICGSTTADVVAKMTGRQVQMLSISNSFAQPPRYQIEGIDLVTEGAVTLNQAYNILHIDSGEYDELSGVTELADMMKQSDTIKFFLGDAKNTGHDSIAFKQVGVLPRQLIVPLMAKKLEDMGKQVIIKEY